MFSLTANAAVKAANILLKALMTYIIRKGCNPSPLVFSTRLQRKKKESGGRDQSGREPFCLKVCILVGVKNLGHVKIKSSIPLTDIYGV